MDDTVLTSQAIAELMRGMTGQGSMASLEPQERKINPLGKPNKRFLGRTINNVLRHNKREIEKTQLSCQQKLQELDDKHVRRKRNVFYSSSYGDDSYVRSVHKKRSRKKSENHSSSRDSTRSSRRSSQKSHSRSRGYDKKHKRTRKVPTKINKRRRSRSASSEADPQPRTTSELSVSKSEYFTHSNNLALAVAIAYSQRMCVVQKEASEPPSLASTSDIIRELMSDEETVNQDLQSDRCSLASSDGFPEIVTIDVSSQDEQSVDTSGSESASESEDDSCRALKKRHNKELTPNNDSDIEIIDYEPEQLRDKISRAPSREQFKLTYDCPSVNIGTTVDLTDD